jgi:imidazolonepropionase-like amidohydrolase
MIEKTSEKIYSEKKPDILIKNVNVIPMDSEKILLKQDVLIKDGLILNITSSGKFPIENNVYIIDGTNKFLIPGLFDMHAHITDKKDVFTFLSFGITTMRNMADVPGWAKYFLGVADVLSIKAEIKDSKLIGPDIFTAGPVLDGENPVSPLNAVIKNRENAIKEVRRQKKAGYDFIKVYDRLSLENFNAILEEANRQNIPVAGHVPIAVGVGRVLQSNQRSIEHLSGYVNNNKVNLFFPKEEIEKYVKLSANSNVWQCPTLVVWHNIPKRDDFDSIRKQPEFSTLSWRMKWLWKTTIGYVYNIEYQGNDFTGEMQKLTIGMFKEMHKAKVKFLAGTDANLLGVYPGSSLHKELELFVSAGMSPFEALQTATVNPARFFNYKDRGKITIGKKADLLLLNKNPLENIKNTRSIEIVFKDGLIIDPSEIMPHH